MGEAIYSFVLWESTTGGLMIVIQLPSKLLRATHEQADKEYIENLVSQVIYKDPKRVDENITIEWGDYYDIRGRGLLTTSQERLELFKEVKSALWSKDHFKK